jgi:hypothetical protein
MTVTRFNKPVSAAQQRAATTSPVQTVANPGRTVVTHEGGPAWLRDKRGELFMLAVVNMAGTGANAFYETAGNRDSRYITLVRELAVEDPQWTHDLLVWLRGPEGNLRTASLIGAAEFVHARLAATRGKVIARPDELNRSIINNVCQRADEPGEMLAYWTSKHGRNVPKPVKRGLADAVRRLYNERSLLKYDTVSHGWRFGDVIDVVHPTPKRSDVSLTIRPDEDLIAALDRDNWQGLLFEHALDRRHGRDKEIPPALKMLRLRAELMAYPQEMRRPTMLANKALLAQAGMTWESLAGWLNGPMDAKAWESVIPEMGYMALLRNLRNFDQAGVNEVTRRFVEQKLADPDEVARSRQLPFRFWSAYKNIASSTWTPFLDRALMLSMGNLPVLDGPSLVLVDTSASMNNLVGGERSTLRCVEAAAVFGVSLALRDPDNVNVYGFATGEFRHQVQRGASAMRSIEGLINSVGKVGHGTDIHGAVYRQFVKGKHRRVFVFSDMQTIASGRGSHLWGGGANLSTLPTDVSFYGFNLAGYRETMAPFGSNNRHEMGGLTDATFKQVPLLERGRDAGWPFYE